MGRHHQRSLQAALVVLIVGTLAEPRAVVPAVSDAQRWIFVVVMYSIAGFAAAPVIARPSRLLRGPGVFLLLSAVWTVLASPFGLRPASDLLLASGYLFLVLAGLHLADALSWQQLEGAIFASLGALMAASWVEIVVTGTLDERATGVFVAFNDLANAAALACFVGVLRLARKSPSGGLLVLISLPLLVLADGRVSQLSLLMAIALAAHADARRRVVIAVAAVAVAAVAVVSLTQSIEETSAAISRSGEADEVLTVTGRTPVWEVAIDEIAASPLFGVGAASTTEMYQVTTSDAASRIEFEVNDAHNVLLQLGLNGGLPAVLFFCLAVLGFVLGVETSTPPLVLGIAVIILVHGVTEHVVREPSALVLILVIALTSTDDVVDLRAQHPSAERVFA